MVVQIKKKNFTRQSLSHYGFIVQNPATINSNKTLRSLFQDWLWTIKIYKEKEIALSKITAISYYSLDLSALFTELPIDKWQNCIMSIQMSFQEQILKAVSIIMPSGWIIKMQCVDRRDKNAHGLCWLIMDSISRSMKKMETKVL